MGRPVDENSVIKIVEYECGEFVGLAKEIGKQIKALPSVRLERKKGKWIKEDITHEIVCSVCNGIRRDDRISHTNFCNCCGSYMGGEQDDID